MKGNGYPRLCLVGVLAWIVCFVPLPSHADKKAEVIVDAIRHHDQLIRSYDVEYKISSSFPNRLPYRKEPNRVVEQELSGRIMRTDTKYRIEHGYVSNYEAPLPETDSVVKREELKNGSDGESFVEIRPSDRRVEVSKEALPLVMNPIHLGVVLTDASQNEGALTQLHQVAWVYVGRERIGDVLCERLDGIHEEKGWQERLWVDPQRGYRMMRLEKEVPPEVDPAVLGDRTEIMTWETTELTEAAPGVWIPTAMKQTIIGREPSGKEWVYHELTATLKVNSVNEDFAPDFFRFDIPPGYMVDDEALGISYQQGRLDITDEEFEDAARTLVAQSENDTPDEPLSTIEAPAKPDVTRTAVLVPRETAQGGWTRVLVWSTLALLLILVTLLVLSKRPKSSA